MRIALLSMTQFADDDPGTLRGAISLVGKTIGERQVDLALILGCERIVCLGQSLNQPILAMQHRAEAAGASFKLISGPHALVGIARAADELLVMADGLLPAQAEALSAFGQGAGVLVLPMEVGVAAGFERIDLNRAWAGMLMVPGRLVERLAELPMDYDPISALLRIALQAKVPDRNIPQNLLDEGSWTLMLSRGVMEAFEPGWLRRHAPLPSLFAPGQALARFVVRKAGPAILYRGWKVGNFVALGIVLAIAGVVLTLFLGPVIGPVAGLTVFALGWICTEAGRALGQLARAGFDDAGEGIHINGKIVWGLEACLAAIVILALPGNWPECAFHALTLLGLLQLSRQLVSAAPAKALQDRAVLAILLATSVAFSVITWVVEVFCLVLLGLLISYLHRKFKANSHSKLTCA